MSRADCAGHGALGQGVFCFEHLNRQREFPLQVVVYFFGPVRASRAAAAPWVIAFLALGNNRAVASQWLAKIPFISHHALYAPSAAVVRALYFTLHKNKASSWRTQNNWGLKREKNDPQIGARFLLCYFFKNIFFFFEWDLENVISRSLKINSREFFSISVRIF